MKALKTITFCFFGDETIVPTTLRHFKGYQPCCMIIIGIKPNRFMNFGDLSMRERRNGERGGQWKEMIIGRF